MSSEDSGWKMPKEKLNKRNNANSRNPRPAKSPATSTSVDMWVEFDKEFEAFHCLSPNEKDKQAKELWEKVQRAITQMACTPEFAQIIQSIHNSIHSNHTEAIETQSSRCIIEGSRVRRQLNFIQLFQSPIESPSTAKTLLIDYHSIITNILLKNEIGQLQLQSLPQIFPSKTTSTVSSPDTFSNLFSDTFPESESLPSHHPSTSNSFYYSHSSLGIGSISKHQPSLHQFALFLLITICFPLDPKLIYQPSSNSPESSCNTQNTLQTITQSITQIIRFPNIMIYDPMFSPLDMHLFSALGLNMLSNTEGKIPLQLAFPDQIPSTLPLTSTVSTQTSTTHHISFIPHCPAGITHNVIASLWQNIQRTIIIANSFEKVMDTLTIPQHYHSLTQTRSISKKKQTNIDPADKHRDQITSTLFPKSFDQFYHILQGLDDELARRSLQQDVAYHSFGLDILADYFNITTISSKNKPDQPPISLQSTSKILPSTGLLLTRPWLTETKISYSPTPFIVNDMSIHTFTKDYTNQNGVIPSFSTFFAECHHLPPYSPPQSSNPELIPTSVRSQ